MKLKQLIIEIMVQDKDLKKGLLSANNNIDKFTVKARAKFNSFVRITERMALKLAAVGVAATYVGLRISKSFITAANTMEQYNLRMTAALRSQSEANRLLQDTARFASKVPFEFRDIAEGATTLAGIMKGGVDQINSWMPLITDLAALTGFTLKETMGQFIRMYSAGASSADLFREKGVLAMLGFQTGARISAMETRKQLASEWMKADSMFRGLTDKLATTWSGLMSMFADAWFLMRVKIMKLGIFQKLKDRAKELLDMLNAWRMSDDFNKFAETLSEKVVGALEKVWTNKDKIIDVFNAITGTAKWLMKSVEGWIMIKDIVVRLSDIPKSNFSYGGMGMVSPPTILMPEAKNMIKNANRQAPNYPAYKGPSLPGMRGWTPTKGYENGFFDGQRPPPDVGEANGFYSRKAFQGSLLDNPRLGGFGNMSLGNQTPVYARPFEQSRNMAYIDKAEKEFKMMSENYTTEMIDPMKQHWENFTWDMQSSWSDSIDSMIMEGDSFATFTKNMFNDVARSFSRMASDMVAERLFERTFGKGGEKGKKYVEDGFDMLMGMVSFGKANK